MSSPPPSAASKSPASRRQRVVGVAMAVLAGVVALVAPGVTDGPASGPESALLMVGDGALRFGDLSGALRQYELAATQDPDDPRPLLRRAHALATVGNWPRAADAIEQAEELGWLADPERPDGLYFDGLRRFARRGDVDGVADVIRALQWKPSRDDGYCVLLAMQRRLGLVEAMDETLELWARHVVPMDPRSERVAALTLEQAGRYDDAIERLLSVQDGAADSVAPTFWRHRDLGRMLSAAGRTGEAVEHLRLAVTMAPLDSESQALLAELTGG
jgi:tetratricopeptide (TPR) repeat protein